MLSERHSESAIFISFRRFLDHSDESVAGDEEDDEEGQDNDDDDDDHRDVGRAANENKVSRQVINRLHECGRQGKEHSQG